MMRILLFRSVKLYGRRCDPGARQLRRDEIDSIGMDGASWLSKTRGCRRILARMMAQIRRIALNWPSSMAQSVHNNDLLNFSFEVCVAHRQDLQNKGNGMDDVQLSTRQTNLLSWLHQSPVEAIDPIRIMKGQFLITMESPAEWISAEDRYDFSPYNWGPYSSDVYRDMEVLEAGGMVSSEPVSGHAWRRYRVTDQGKQFASEAESSFPAAMIGYFAAIGEFVGTKDFSELLRAIYAKYPKYATASLFKG